MLKGKNVIVTGSTGGIGLGIAKVFLEKGCRVMFHGLDKHYDTKALEKKVFEERTPQAPSRASSRQESSQQEAPQSFYCQADLYDPQACAHLINDAFEKMGTIDVVVNNAGVQHTSPAEDFPLDQWHFVLQVNLSAAFFITKAVLPHMYKKKWGRLIHIGSVHSLVGSKNKAAYVAAKHGLVGLSKVVALEAAGTGVTSNVVCPGWVLTPLVEKQIQDIANKENISFEVAKKRLLCEKQPSGEFITTHDMGDMVAFLASESARQITGTTLTMDGGWTAR